MVPLESQLRSLFSMRHQRVDVQGGLSPRPPKVVPYGGQPGIPYRVYRPERHRPPEETGRRVNLNLQHQQVLD